MLSSNKTSLYRSLLPWLVWLFATAFYFYKNALEVAPSVMANDWMQTFALNATAFGNLGSCYFYSYLLMQLPIGILLDYFSPKRVITIAILLCAVGTLMVGHASTFYMAAIGRLITGIGASAAGIGCCKLITLWFPQQRFALMVGLMISIGMLGSVLAQAPLALITNHIGWRSTLLYASYIGLAFTLLFGLIVRSRPEKTNPQPSLLSIQETIFDIRLVVKDMLAVLRKKENWIVSLYSGLSFTLILTFGSLWGVPYLQTVNGLEKTIAASVVSAIFLGFAVGSPFTAWLSNLLKRRLSVMVVGTGISLLLTLSALYTPDLPLNLLYILLFLVGFSLSTSLLSFSLIKEINQLSLAGSAFGFMNTFCTAVGAITNPLLGRLLDMHWHGQILNGMRIFPPHAYLIAMSVLPLFLLFSIACLFFSHETHGEQNS